MVETPERTGPIVRARWVPPWRFAVMVLAGGLAGCNGGMDTNLHNNLEAMNTARIQLKGRTLEVWLATGPREQEYGLMQVTSEQLAAIPPDAAAGLPEGADRGMLFVFRDDQLRAFWMYNTITALDIAYIRSDGVIVKTHTMAPLETRLYPSVEPAKFALEVRAGLLADLGVAAGDRVEIPDSLLKGTP